ncbi:MULTISPECIES: RNA-directed DNA polymerase [unclassified Minwuia]|jgi:Reverse transcriptase (RNA-dependent DNA polymerase)|uniref:RNA-directed DNA polymerase n=1 Tax=unclassified Minwuia TaxID=2618799 RepID=UPI00247A2AA7|nr:MULTISPECIES: RNA-directed DNA polymerase [unclassified Minwuia]
MVKKTEFASAAELSVQNVIRHGDTDIFPFPFENHAFFDKQPELISLIKKYDENFEEYLIQYPPKNVSSLTPATYSGFRWATQIDPIWNMHFLASVISIGTKIEEARIGQDHETIFSYRFNPNKETGDIFDRDTGWLQFMRRSLKLAEIHPFTVICDISEFYPRLGHHRLENALRQVAGDTPYPKKIMSFLSNFSNTNSFGLPIGGPAARLLSEITINQVDKLLNSKGIVFTRFADDYHLFSQSKEDAYRFLIYLSEKLFINQGLTLQKSKTRIMSSAEFKATNPIKGEQETGGNQIVDPPADHTRNTLMRFSLRFDPYSPTADDDYEALKAEVKKFDIIGLLKQELAKSRVHTSLARKIISAIKFLEGSTKQDAVLSVLENCDVLYPIFSSVLMMIDDQFDDLEIDTQTSVIDRIQQLINQDSHVFRVDIHLSFAIRVLSHRNTSETQLLLQKLFDTRPSELVRRDIILVMARWGEWYWLSDLKNRYRELSAPERRAFIASSFILRDEGKHWRDHMKKEFDPFEEFILQWASEKKGLQQEWSVPL